MEGFADEFEHCMSKADSRVLKVDDGREHFCQTRLSCAPEQEFIQKQRQVHRVQQLLVGDGRSELEGSVISALSRKLHNDANIVSVVCVNGVSIFMSDFESLLQMVHII